MKGLLVKDFKLLKNMKNSMIVILIIAVGMSVYISDLTFIIVYLSFLGSSFTTGTLSYDEFDNGYAFLFSLPVTRKHYVMEKYIFGLLISGGGWLLGLVLAAISGMVRNNGSVMEWLMIGLGLLPFPLIVLAFVLPLHIKFGGEKGRIGMICVLGGVFLIGVLGAKVLQMLHLDLGALTESLSTMGEGMIILCADLAGVLFLAVSIGISNSIMKKKEF